MFANVIYRERALESFTRHFWWGDFLLFNNKKLHYFCPQKKKLSLPTGPLCWACRVVELLGELCCSVVRRLPKLVASKTGLSSSMFKQLCCASLLQLSFFFLFPHLDSDPGPQLPIRHSFLSSLKKKEQSNFKVVATFKIQNSKAFIKYGCFFSQMYLQQSHQTFPVSANAEP